MAIPSLSFELGQVGRGVGSLPVSRGLRKPSECRSRPWTAFGPEGPVRRDERTGQSELAANERVFLPCRRLTHLVADSPRLLVSSVILPSACTSTTVFIMRPRT